jgi:hypothetical protein
MLAVSTNVGLEHGSRMLALRHDSEVLEAGLEVLQFGSMFGSGSAMASGAWDLTSMLWMMCKTEWRCTDALGLQILGLQTATRRCCSCSLVMQ